MPEFKKIRRKGRLHYGIECIFGSFMGFLVDVEFRDIPVFFLISCDCLW